MALSAGADSSPRRWLMPARALDQRRGHGEEVDHRPRSSGIHRRAPMGGRSGGRGRNGPAEPNSGRTGRA